MMDFGVPGDGLWDQEEAALDARPDDPPDCPNGAHNWTRWSFALTYFLCEERYCMSCRWVEWREFKP